MMQERGAPCAVAAATGLVNGGTVAGIAMVGTVAALVFGMYQDAIAGGVVLGAGLLEITGAAMVRRERLEGFRWMKSAQVLLFLSISMYVVVRIIHFPAITFSASGFLGEGLMMTAELLNTQLLVRAAFGGLVVLLCAMLQTGLFLFYRMLQRQAESK